MSFTSDFLKVSSSNFISSLIGFLITILLYRNYSEILIAEYELTLTLFLIILELSDLGFNVSFVDYCSKFPKNKDIAKSSGKILKILTHVILYLLFLIGSFLFPGILKSTSLETIALICLGSLITSLANFEIVIKQLENKFTVASVFILLIAVTKFTMISSYIFIVESNQNTSFLIFLFTCSPLIIILSSLRNNTFSLHFDRSVLNSILKTGVILFIASVSTGTGQKSIIFLINKYLTIEDVANYGLIARINGILVILISSLTFTLLPSIKERVTSKTFTDLNISLKKYLLHLLVILTLGFLVIRELIPIVFGDSYSRSIIHIQILFLSFPISLITSVYGLVILNRGSVKYLLFLNIGQAILVLSVGFTLIPSIGLYGATLCLILSKIIGFFVLRRKTKLLINE